MREALLRRRYGIPLILLAAILIGVGIAVAAFTYVYKVQPKVQRPVSEQKTDTVTVASGHFFSKTRKLDLALPGTYNLTYKLTGDSNDHLKDELAEIWLDTNEDGIFDRGPKIIDTLGNSVTFNGISGGTNGQLIQTITIEATAKDKVIVGTGWTSGDQNLTFDEVTTELIVSMEPTTA